MRHTLESSPVFPVIAWSLIIGFTAFTWTLTVHLKQELTVISANAVDSAEYIEKVQARNAANQARLKSTESE